MTTELKDVSKNSEKEEVPNSARALNQQVGDLESNKQQKEQKQPEKKKCDLKYWSIRIAIILLLVVIVILIIIYNEWVKETTTAFLDWLRDNPALGTVCLALIYIVATLIFLPGSLLTLGAGVALQAAFDNTPIAVAVGSLGVFVGAWVGSTLAFLLGRYLFRSSAKNMAAKHRVIKAIDVVMQNEGLKFTFLLRLCPLIPYNAFNYVMGITAVTFKSYVIAGLGMIPGTIVYVFVGTTIGNIAEAASGEFEGGTVTLVLLIVGTILAFVAIVYISIVVKRYLNKQLKTTPENSEKDDTEPPQND